MEVCQTINFAIFHAIEKNVIQMGPYGQTELPSKVGTPITHTHTNPQEEIILLETRHSPFDTLFAILILAWIPKAIATHKGMGHQWYKYQTVKCHFTSLFIKLKLEFQTYPCIDFKMHATDTNQKGYMRCLHQNRTCIQPQGQNQIR